MARFREIEGCPSTFFLAPEWAKRAQKLRRWALLWQPLFSSHLMIVICIFIASDCTSDWTAFSYFGRMNTTSRDAESPRAYHTERLYAWVVLFTCGTSEPLCLVMSLGFASCSADRKKSLLRARNTPHIWVFVEEKKPLNNMFVKSVLAERQQEKEAQTPTCENGEKARKRHHQCWRKGHTSLRKFMTVNRVPLWAGLASERFLSTRIHTSPEALNSISNDREKSHIFCTLLCKASAPWIIT